MLLITQSKSVIDTQKYFETVLIQSDYYLGQEVAGHWFGKGAELLGIGEGAKVTSEQFRQLLRGNHPLTGEQLAQRLRKDRRPGMDLTFSVPKSVSLAWALGGDERILELLYEAVRETMEVDVETLMQRRVRKGKHANSKDRTDTGKLIYADFLHKTSRPVDGVPDPHLHIHAFVMNWTLDEDEHFAGEFEEIVRQRVSLQAKFESRLARKLEKLGYSVELVRFLQSGKLKRGWEIKGILRSIIEKFSRRTAQIEEYAEEHGIEDAEKKGQLGKLTREKKDTEFSIQDLTTIWRDRLTADELAIFDSLVEEKQRAEEVKEQEQELERAIHSVTYALDHHLYRQSTVERHEIVATALEHGLTLKPEDIEQALDSIDLIKREVLVNGSKRYLITTRSVLEAEQQLISFARDGRGTRKAIGTDRYDISRDWLNDHQKEAVRYVLTSRDTVMAIIGGAGTGKTSLMEEAIEAIEKQRKEVYTFTPSTGAKEVLEEKGFKKSQTVEHLVRNSKLQEQLKNQVIWIDEAGLLDVRSMNKVFEIAKAQNCRVVLSGDTRQHASPRRGEAMRLLEKEAGLKMARAEKIQRQKGQYRRAVEMISKGYEIVDARTGKTGLLAGYDLLVAMGKVKEIASEDRHAQLAETYLNTLSKGKTSLVVAPTHREAQSATQEIRKKLQELKKLSEKEKLFTKYQSLNLSEAEKREASTYQDKENLIVQFHQNVTGGFDRGDRYRVLSAKEGTVELMSLGDHQVKKLPLSATDRFEVYTQKELSIAAGDKIRFSLGGKTRDKQGRISNGRLDEVKGFDRRGNIVLKNGWVVDKEYAHLDLGYVITSHASQGKDCHMAIGAMGSESLPAINARQFYVTVSRGRDDVVLFVDDKKKIRNAIQRSAEQMSATDMVRSSALDKVRKNETHKKRQKQQTLRSFRNRIWNWWKGLNRTKSASPPIGRHRQANARKDLGIDRYPGMDRSRA